MALDQWVQFDEEPPLSAVAFPKLPGVQFPTRIQQAWHVDYGEEFRSAGIVTIEPPEVGSAFPMRLPQVDADGNETAGIKMPATAVPLATYTGWNLRAAAIGTPDELYSMTESHISFARTKAERVKTGDLVQGRFLLERDVPLVVARASAEWDFVTR